MTVVLLYTKEQYIIFNVLRNCPDMPTAVESNVKRPTLTTDFLDNTY